MRSFTLTLTLLLHYAFTNLHESQTEMRGGILNGVKPLVSQNVVESLKY